MISIVTGGANTYMNAYKCDRCGGYFDPPLKKIILMFGTGSNGYEVCPDCYKEVEGYLKNESVEDLYTAYADNKPLYSCSKEVTNDLLNKKED